jgi:glycosyltransferase involved in cell wall biosynthesis
LKFFYKYYREIAQYPDAEKGWKPFAVKAADELLQKEQVDALVSCSSPVISHIIAEELKKKYSIPWVADFRDLWTQNHHYPYSPARKMFERRLETKTLATADALVTVSEPLSKELATLHKKEVYTVTNGFDPDKMSNGKVALTSKFTITYTGQIYPKQDPTKLLLALKDLTTNGVIDPSQVEVRFYGPESLDLESKAIALGLSNIVRQYGVMSREFCFEKQRESQLLLLFNWEDLRQRGVYSGKVFEYLAARRPILATGGADSVVTDLLKETNAGVNACTVEDIKNALAKAYGEHQLRGKVSYQGNIDQINKYSYREMARKFAVIMNSLVA